jgi:prepilin-type processing-associated H-X9-DG protein
MNIERHEFAPRSRAANAFTFMELLVVLITLGLLAAMLLPALAKTGSGTRAFQCLNNLRQIQHGWLMYSADNIDRIAPTTGFSTAGGNSYQVTFLPDARTNPGNPGNQWIYGRIDIPLTSTNINLLKLGLIFPYCPNVALFKCPADQRTEFFLTTGGGPLTVRSISMNGYMNPIDGSTAPLNAAYRIFKKQSELAGIGPANIWVLIEENPYSINDSWFCENPDPAAPQWIDCPATYHNNAGALSFADGHAEIKKWRDQNLLNYKDPNGSRITFQPGTDDLHWLGQRTSIH